MDELYTNQNTNTVTDFPKPENTNASFNAPTFQEAPVSSPYYREQAAPQSVQRTVPNSVPQSVQQTIPQMNTQPVQLNKEQPQTQNFNPYSVTTQYSPTDFQAQKPKKPKNKNAFLAVIAVCLSLVISGGSFYAGVNYFAHNNADGNTAATSTNIIPSASTLTYAGDNVEVSNTVTEVVEQVMPSMVSISTIVETQMSGTYGYFYNFIFGDDYNPTYETSASGSGIIIGQNEEELLIVTNYHVIEDSKEIAAEFIDGQSYSATIKGTAADSDLAVISVKISDISADTLSQIKVAVLGDSDSLKLGEPAIAIGNALGYGQSVTVGYISAVERTVQLSDKTMTLLQTDAAINPGNSGGALLNIKGEVIGINSAKYSDTSVEGTGYAIPISTAAPIINDLMNSTYVSDEEKPYLGIYGSTVPSTYQDRFGWPAGVYVSKVVGNSPAQLAGLQSGDIITAINDSEITSMEDLENVLNGCKAGDKVSIAVTRNDDRGNSKTGTLTAVLIAKGDVEANSIDTFE
ncbi:MAG: trypsin-like peptidase domain-containing protein [Clostridia bacterium]|nr:trypsin-like peptidase domain-containing protein [Clostridia bacterium]MBQ2151918.1 trypsin-like peptidase domain-containing protein [Clostridia bacterium]MBQ2348553.1 trypsin-like peptidase domain-containing protein [Clostridia bacterium]